MPAETEELHRLRLTTDVIYKGPRLSPSASKLVAKNLSTQAHVVAFSDIHNIEVQFVDKDERVIYAHHHEGSSGYCTEGCLDQAQDGHDQDL